MLLFSSLNQEMAEPFLDLGKEILVEDNILVGDALEVVIIKEQILIKPIRKIRGK